MLKEADIRVLASNFKRLPKAAIQYQLTRGALNGKNKREADIKNEDLNSFCGRHRAILDGMATLFAFQFFNIVAKSERSAQ